MGDPGDPNLYRPKHVTPTPEPHKWATLDPVQPTPEVLAQPELQSWAKGPDVDPIMTALTGGSSIGAGIGAGIKEDIWDPTIGFFGDVFNKLAVPSHISSSFINYAGLMGGMGPDPSVPTSMQAYVPPKNYDRNPTEQIEKVWDAYNKKENDSFNLVDFATAMNEAGEIPEWLQNISQIVYDPLWMSPAKLRALPLATGITKGLPGLARIDTATKGKYLPFLGGFDWMKPFSNAGQSTNAASLAATKVIDDTLIEAEKLDTSLKAAGKETTTEVAGFVPKPKVKRIPVPDIPQVRAIIQKVKEAKPLTKLQKEAYSEERAARITAFRREMDDVFKESGNWPDKEMFRELLKKHLDGEMTRVAWSPLMGEVGPEAFTQTDYDVITKYIAEFSGDRGYDYIANMQAWFALADGSTVPQPAQLKRLERMFGTAFIEGFSEPLGKVDQAWAAAIDLIGLPRTIVSSFDASAALRQARPLLAENPKEFQEAFAAMHKVMLSEGGALAIEESILSHKLYAYAEAGGLFYAQRGSKAIGKEEAFVSRLSKWIPGVKQSERAYTTFLNKFRHDIYFKTVEQWHASGVTKNLQDYKDLASIINWGTGRGPNPFAFLTSKGGTANKVADLANAAFFAPRFTSAGPAFIIGGAFKSTRNEAVSKIWGANMASFMQSSVMWMRFLDMAGAEIEMNPASSDFGKGKIGSHRFDFFGGYLPLARYSYQTITGKRKSLGTDQTYDISRIEPLKRWIESKLSPSGALGLDTFTGEDFLGETVDWRSTEGWKSEWDRLVPMVVGDFVEAWQQYESPAEMLQNPAVPLGLAFSIYGGGFQSFTTTKDLKDKVTNQIWPTMVYDDLPIDSDEQFRVDNHPIIKDHYEELEARRPSPTGQEKWRTGINNWADVNTRILETGLEPEVAPGYITLVNQQGPGKQQRKFIQSFNDARWHNWVTNIPKEAEEWQKAKTFDHLVKIMDERNSQAALLREKYWSISAPMILINNGDSGLYVDLQEFDYQKQKRAEVIRDAISLGVVGTLTDENGNTYPDPTDKNLEIITSKRPIYTEDEPDPEKIKFQQTLTEYSTDSEFLGEHFFSMDREYFKDFYPDNSEAMYKDHLKYLYSRTTALDDAVDDGRTRYDYKEMTAGVNDYKRNARSIGWEEEIVSPEHKERAKHITRLLLKWGYLRLDDTTIPTSMLIELEKEFQPQQEQNIQQFLR